jgi:hypothetical protein
MIANTPSNFIIRTNHNYPPNNTQIFEEFFYDYYKNNNIETERIYIPILWTNLYISRNYGNANMLDIQNYLDNLDKSKKYFTILQYDDGILQDLKDLDILVFCAGGGGQKLVPDKNIGYPIPLITKPNPNINLNKNRDILCSFIGAIRGRHKIREIMANYLSTLPNYFISESVGYNKFTDIMERSIFSLCPRGYGATSFRICESLQHGSIPIYIYDRDWTPWYDEFDFNDIGIKVHANNIQQIPNIINNITKEQVKKYHENGKLIYEKYFTYDGCTKKIIDKLNK